MATPRRSRNREQESDEDIIQLEVPDPETDPEGYENWLKWQPILLPPDPSPSIDIDLNPDDYESIP